MKVAIYPGTFDPITNGHLDMIGRANRLFERVVVGIAGSPYNRPNLSLPTRSQPAGECTDVFDNVGIIGCSGLRTALRQGQQARIILRGLRAVSDFEYERPLANMTRPQRPHLETVFLTSEVENSYISSTLV